MDYNFVISGQIGSWWNNANGDYVRYMLSQNKGKEVHVGFCSLGGSVQAGLEMYQAFKDHGNVYAHAFGMNASISTIAMLGCKSIDIVKGSFFLIHNVSTSVTHWEMANKERIDEIVAKLKGERDELKTFDEVLASLYADKCKKKNEEILAQMKKGNWMSAQEALDFGLVDSIREDKKTEEAAKEFADQFVNCYSLYNYQDAGIPPLVADDKTAASIADAEGNPTPNFIRKTWDKLQSLLQSEQQAITKPKNSMIKIFNSVMTLLACADGFKPMDDGNIALTQEQMKTIDDQLTKQANEIKEKENSIKELEDSIKNLKADKAKLENDVKERDKQIKNLKEAPAVDNSVTDEPGKKADAEMSTNDMFNLVNI